MIAIAIVEDDQQEQKRLQQYLMRYAMENQQTFSFALYSNALDYLEDKQKFDIVFMDIMLPNMTGMEAAARMRAYDSKTVLIFVTTMVQFAIKSYEVDALDYIVKPVNYARLTMKLQKAIRVIESNSGGTVVINDAQGMIRCSTNELLYVEEWHLQCIRLAQRFGERPAYIQFYALQCLLSGQSAVYQES